MKLFKNYKKLYLSEKNAKELYYKAYKENYEKNIKMQKEIIRLKKELSKAKSKVKVNKERKVVKKEKEGK